MGDKMKKSNRYLKGFREGFNNPNQYKNENILNSNNDYIKGIVAGICKRRTNIQNGKAGFIWNDEDLRREVQK